MLQGAADDKLKSAYEQSSLQSYCSKKYDCVVEPFQADELQPK